MYRLHRKTVMFVSVIIILINFIALSCTRTDTWKPVDRTPTIKTTTDLILGSEDQPMEYQLGRPIAVRTDKEGNIYIVDRASKQIKVFDEEGNHLKNLGGRGRGPGEFQDMELPVEWTPEGNLVIMDRGKLQYTVISTEGEQVNEYPYNLSDQYYPQAIEYVDGQMLSIFLSGSNPSDPPPIFDRHLIYIYSGNFQKKRTSFLPFRRLGFEDRYVYARFIYHIGSFDLASKQDRFVYSPGIYNGTLYVFRKLENQWEFDRTISGIEPHGEPYEIYSSEEQVLMAEKKEIPGAMTTNYGGANYGRLRSADAGIYYLQDGRLAHFIAEWREGDRIESESQHLLDISVQIFDKNLELQTHSYLFSIERRDLIRSRLINWKDDQDRFYFINPGNDMYLSTIPTVRRFSLEL